MVERNMLLIKALFCEFVGAFLINVLTFTYTFQLQSYVIIALIYGTINASLMLGLGPLSGGHLNPAVTISLWVIGKVSRSCLMRLTAFL